MATNSKPKIIVRKKLKPATDAAPLPVNDTPLGDQISDLQADLAQAKETLEGAPIPKRKGGARPGAGRKPNVAPGPSAEETAASNEALRQMSEAMLPMLRTIGQLPFAALAAKTGYEGWALSKEEADMLGQQIDVVLKIYLPQLEGEHAPLAVLGFTLVCLGAGRYIGYQSWQAKQNEILAAALNTAVTGPSSV